MPSSYTDLGFELQAAGENLNTWGDPHWNNTAKRINYAISGYRSIALTGDAALTSSNTSTDRDQFTSRHGLLKFTGTLASVATITVPSTEMRWLIWNAASKAIIITTGAGATVTIDPDAIVQVLCDGSACKEPGYAGLGLKDYVDAAVLTATGSLPATTGNNGKVLACVLGAWTPTLIDSSYISGFSASSSDIWAGTTLTKAVTPGGYYTSAAEVTLTDAATVAVDMSTFIDARVTLAGNRTLGNPTNPKVGQSGWIAVVQDGSGSRTLAFSGNWKRSGGAPTLSTAAGAIDFIEYQVINSTYILYDLIKSPS